jgi:hypothetical protein
LPLELLTVRLFFTLVAFNQAGSSLGFGLRRVRFGLERPTPVRLPSGGTLTVGTFTVTANARPQRVTVERRHDHVHSIRLLV